MVETLNLLVICAKAIHQEVGKMLEREKEKEMKSLLSQDTRTAVKAVIEELVRMRRTFTGKDVYDRMHNKHIRRDQKYDQCVGTEKEVSTYVRMLFNGADTCFMAYGSSLVPHPKGPVLYFALPYHAKIKATRIVDTLP
jgi:hypothetical protein